MSTLNQMTQAMSLGFIYTHPVWTWNLLFSQTYMVGRGRRYVVPTTVGVVVYYGSTLTVAIADVLGYSSIELP